MVERDGTGRFSAGGGLMDPTLHELLTTPNLSLEGRDFKGLTVEVWEDLRASRLILKVYRGEKLLLQHIHTLPKYGAEGTYLQKVEDCVESYLASTRLMKSKTKKEAGQRPVVRRIR